MASVLLEAKQFDRAAALHFKRWTSRSLKAVRACLVNGERVSVVAKTHHMKPQTLVNARVRFLRRYYAEQLVKVDAEAFMKRFAPDGAAALKPFTSQLRRLMVSGYSKPQIQAYLKLNDVTVPSPTLSAFLRRAEPLKILSLHNRKGGVGKTALAVQLSYDLKCRGYRTLCLEFDGQRNASNAFARGGTAVLAPFTSLSVFQAKAGAVPDGNLIVVPADEVMDRMFDAGAGEYNGFINNLADWFRSVDERFDVCVIDNAPGEDIRWGAGMATADAVLIPTTLRQETLEGVESFLNHPEYGFKRMKGGRAKGPNGSALKPVNPDLKLLGILPNLVMRSALEAQALDWLTTHYPTLLMTLPSGATAVLKHRLIVPFAQMRGVFLGSLNTQEARDLWAEMKPIFDEIVRQLGLALPTPAIAPVIGVV